MNYDYSVEDENHANCPHDCGYWIVEEIKICPECGAVVGYTWETELIQTSASNETVYFDYRAENKP